MIQRESNICYIDGANLYEGIKFINKELDYSRLLNWLKVKYKVSQAYIFLGYIEKYQKTYNFLRKSGFKLIFKESLFQSGNYKGNADAEMVLKVVCDFYEENIASVVIISGDGDFSCLIDFLVTKKVLKILLMPNRKYSSYLLRKKNITKEFLETPHILDKITRLKKRAPDRIN